MKLQQWWPPLTTALNRKSKQKQTNKIRNKYTAIFLMVSLLFSQHNYAATNTGLAGDDKYAGPFPMGFDFNYYGTTFNQFYVTTNGLIQFTNPTTNYSNQCLPSLNNTLYVFWDDLRTDVSGQPTGKIQYEIQGVTPNRKLIVQWTNQYFYGSNLPMGTFQAILTEGSNQIKYQYRYLSDERSKGYSATLGIQGTAAKYAQIGCNQANIIAPEQAISFTPNQDFSQYTVDQHANYDFIDISGLAVSAPSVSARYSNQSPAWSWQPINTLNTYEIEIQDEAGHVVHQQILGNVTQFTFTDGLEDGKSYRARIRGSINHGGTWEVWSALSAPITIDTTKPTVELTQFSRVNSDTVQLAFNSNDNLSGIASVHLQIANSPDFTTLLTDKDINIHNGTIQINDLHTKGALYARLMVTDKAGNQSDYTVPKVLILPAPILINPIASSKVNTKILTVQGTAESDGQVQLYLDNQPISELVSVDDKGFFSQNIQLTEEGSHQLTAQLFNDGINSDLTQPITFNFTLPIPIATITAPVKQQQILAPTDIQISANDKIGIDHIDIQVDKHLLGTVTESPYQIHWPLTLRDNGTHTITATVTNTSGKVTSTSNTVTVNIVPPAPPPTPYTGKITSISPESSYGEQTITITGQANNRADNTPAANVPLILVLKVNGFIRKIALASDSAGHFSYIFKPQESDQGVYQVGIIHPDETTINTPSGFSINRITFSPQRYNLKVPFNIATTFKVNAIASTDTSKLHWTLAADQQPDGVLPKGIHITSEPVDLKAGKTLSIPVTITADNTADNHGIFNLTAVSADSGNLVRGKLQVNYQLGKAVPTLNALPTYIQTGMAQGSSSNAEIQLTNTGLVDVENIQLQLTDRNGQPAPNWLFMTGDKNLDRLTINKKTPVQIVFQPSQNVAEGIYQFNLSVAAQNMPTGHIPIQVSVTQNAQGNVQFDVADIYTATLDEQGQPIAGVKNATIKLQNEAVLTQEYSLTTNNEGIASLDKLPAGTYRYRASAPDHRDISGRIVIRPGATTQQHLFLEYETVNIEFGVTETTIKDVYDLNLNATFNTQVPAPVVLIEPLSINLGNMRTGETKTGQLTISNYGLIQAKNIALTLPKSDNRFKYEFFGEVPNVLLPKEKKVISYRITALDPAATKHTAKDTQPRSSNICNRYLTNYIEQHESECANGDISKGNSSGYFYHYFGSDCAASGNVGIGDGTGFTGDFGGSGGLNAATGFATPSAIPITAGCSPEAPCASAGTAGGAN